MDDALIFLVKAEESLVGAEFELEGRRFNNCANRSYYACFQAAVSALLQSGVHSSSADGRWGHDFVQARFVGDLINRRKVYAGDHRNTLERLFLVRQVADYKPMQVTESQARRGLRRSSQFVTEVRLRRG